MEPLTSGKYPDTMRKLVGKRLPEFSAEESTLLAGSFDFLGLNYYTTNYAANRPKVEPSTTSKDEPSYTTDANVTYLSEKFSIFQLCKLYILNFLISHLAFVFVAQLNAMVFRSVLRYVYEHVKF